MKTKRAAFNPRFSLIQNHPDKASDSELLAYKQRIESLIKKFNSSPFVSSAKAKYNKINEELKKRGLGQIVFAKTKAFSIVENIEKPFRELGGYITRAGTRKELDLGWKLEANPYIKDQYRLFIFDKKEVGHRKHRAFVDVLIQSMANKDSLPVIKLYLSIWPTSKSVPVWKTVITFSFDNNGSINNGQIASTVVSFFGKKPPYPTLGGKPLVASESKGVPMKRTELARRLLKLARDIGADKAPMNEKEWWEWAKKDLAYKAPEQREDAILHLSAAYKWYKSPEQVKAILRRLAGI